MVKHAVDRATDVRNQGGQLHMLQNNSEAASGQADVSSCKSAHLGRPRHTAAFPSGA